MIDSKIADERITKDSKNSQWFNSETVTNEHDKELPKNKLYISKRKTKNIDNLDINIITGSKIKFKTLMLTSMWLRTMCLWWCIYTCESNYNNYWSRGRWYCNLLTT